MNVRVGFISYALDRARGGIGRYNRELLRALHDEQTTVIELRAGQGQCRGRSVSLPGSGLLPGLLTAGQIAIGWAAWRHRLDVVHDPTGTVPILLASARRVTTIHDVIPYLHPSTSTTLDRLIYRHWLPRAVRHVDAVITVSEQSRRDILKFLPLRPEQVTVIPCGVSARFRPRSLAEIQPTLRRLGIEPPYVLYVGSVEARKNLSRLLAAYARLRPWSERWTLVVVGARGWQASEIVDHVRHLELLPFVRFTGFVADDDLAALYAGSDLFVFPSLYEGFGIPVVEAMASGVPVVTSNGSALAEVAGDAATLVDPLDVDSIATGMRSVLADRSLADDLRLRGRERAGEFSWQRTARDVVKVYEKFLD